MHKFGALYARQDPNQRKKHEALCARRERQWKAEAKARQPKKPQSAYVLFCAEARMGLQEAHPEAGFAEVARMLGKLWHDLGEAEKAAYDELAAADLKRYICECDTAGIDPGKAARAAQGPLPALSALGFFKARCEAAMGISLSLSVTGEACARDVLNLPAEVAALLQEGMEALPYDEADELRDLACGDAERHEEEVEAQQEAAAKRRRAKATAVGEGREVEGVVAATAAAEEEENGGGALLGVRVKRPRGA